jgi:FkbM family methyltransferase
MMEAISKKITKSKIGFDIGANIGITSIWMSQYFDQVYSFEPEFQNIERFKENIEINKVKNIKLIPFALSDKEGLDTLNIFKSYGHHSLSDQHISAPIATQEVVLITLDKFCEDNSIEYIDFLKIDVEGFEFEVLNGSKKMLTNKKIKLIAFEHSPILLKNQNRDPKSVLEYLISANYTIFKLNGTPVNIENIEELSQEDLYAL